MSALWTVIVLLLGLISAEPAHAHDAIQGVDGFRGGLVHPLLIPAHALSLLALGLMVGRQEDRLRRGVLLAAFAAGLSIAILAVISALALFDSDLVLLGCAAFAAFGTAAAVRIPRIAAVPLMVVAGAALLLDSVPSLISTSETLFALAGTSLGAQLLLAVVATNSADLTRDWQRIAVRVLASWVCASVILVLAMRFAAWR